MALYTIARQLVASSAGKSGPTIQQVDAQGASPMPTSEQLTKYIPSEVVGIVTGAYGIVIPLVKGNRQDLDRWLILIGVLGFLALVLILSIQMVLELRKTNSSIGLMSLVISGPAAWELSLVSMCYAAWVTSLMSGFLDQPVPMIAGLATIVVIHLIEPIRKLL